MYLDCEGGVPGVSGGGGSELSGNEGVHINSPFQFNGIHMATEHPQ